MEKYKEIERSIIKKYRKEIWRKFVKAIQEYELIKENDNIMVCISGGKDSFLMAKCMQELQRYSKIKFNVCYVVMDPGYSAYNRDFIIDSVLYYFLYQNQYEKFFYFFSRISESSIGRSRSE